MYLTSTSSLTTFRAPPVEPAEAPMTISTKSSERAKGGQAAKSAVAKPVVVIIEAVLKLPYLKASPIVMPIFMMRSRLMSSTAPMRRAM